MNLVRNTKNQKYFTYEVRDELKHNINIPRWLLRVLLCNLPRALMKYGSPSLEISWLAEDFRRLRIL